MVLPLSPVDSHRGQWPIAAVLALLLLGELIVMNGPSRSEALVWLISVPPCIAAVASFKSRAFAIPVTVMSIFLASLVMRLFYVNLPTILSPLTIAETGACLVLTAVVVREEPRRAATWSVGSLMAVSLFAALVRDNWLSGNNYS